MKFGKIAAAAAAVTLAAAPIAAQADMGRIAAPVAGESEAGGGGAGAILAVFALAALAIGISGGSERPPASA
ncbi:hypothetical protein [Parerythrobacter jejuensis]|uniref:Ferrochelatase n=1 Tax=Parerythrobacter jejuensis TaxID=795812 RepID=A0A845AZ35_9SPHN|nr:hypothetical protein [Parerythrobacter jejuensis]MXP32018.1 hypothetical protein [Parerythrobacter jejuensis]